MNRPDIETIEIRLAGVTGGPWQVGESGECIIAPSVTDTIGDSQYYGGTLIAESVFRGPSDVQFIASSRNDVHALCAYVRHLEAEREAIRQMLEVSLSTKPPSLCEENPDVFEWSGGNADDAYQLGLEAGEWTASDRIAQAMRKGLTT